MTHTKKMQKNTKMRLLYIGLKRYNILFIFRFSPFLFNSDHLSIQSKVLVLHEYLHQLKCLMYSITDYIMNN